MAYRVELSDVMISAAMVYRNICSVNEILTDHERLISVPHGSEPSGVVILTAKDVEMLFPPTRL